VSPPSSRQPHPAPAAANPRARPIENAAEGAQLLGRLHGTMDALLGLVEEETALVRKGRLREAAVIGINKSELARAYFDDAERVKANAKFLSARAPLPLEHLRARHESFRARLQVNLTVLATAHAVSEGIVRGVAGEMQRKSAPQTYGASGRANSSGRGAARPIAISRTS
jgi:hypothetical protein